MMTSEDLDNFISSELKKEYDRLKEGDDSLFEPGEREKLVEALALVHDWFCFPSQWLVTKVNND